MSRHSLFAALILSWLFASVSVANRNPWDNEHKLDPNFDRRLSHQLAYRNRLYNIFLSDAQYLNDAPALARAIWTRLSNRCTRMVVHSDLKDSQSHLRIPVTASRRLCEILSQTHAQLNRTDTGLAGFRISADTFLHLHSEVSAGSGSPFSVREIAVPGDLFVPEVYQGTSYPVGENHPTVEHATQALLALLLRDHPEAQKVKQNLWMANGCYSSLRPQRCGPDFVQNLVQLWSPPEVRMVSGAHMSGWWDSVARFIQKAEREHQLREGLPSRLTAPADIILGADARNGIYRVRAHEIRSRALWGAEQRQYRGTACGDPKAERWLSRAAAASECVSIPLKSLLSEQTLGFIQDKLLKNFGAGSLHTRSNADKLLNLSNKAAATAATGAFVWFGWRLASLFAPAKVSQVAGLVGGTSTAGAVSHAVPYAAAAKRAYGAVALLELLGLAWPGLEKWIGQPASRALYWLSGGDLFAASWAWVDEAMDSQNRDLNHRSRVMLAESLEALGKSQASVEARNLSDEEFARLSGSGGKSGGFFELWASASASDDRRECGVRPQAPAYLIQLPRALCEVCDRAQAKSPEACLKELLDIQMRDRSASSLVFGRLLDRDQKLSQAERHLQSLERLTLEWTGVAAKLNGKPIKSPPVAAPKSVEDESPVLWIDN